MGSRIVLLATAVPFSKRVKSRNTAAVMVSFFVTYTHTLAAEQEEEQQEQERHRTSTKRRSGTAPRHTLVSHWQVPCCSGGGRRRAVRSGNHNKQKSLSCWCTFLPQPPLQPLTPLSMQSESLPALAVQHTSTRHTHTHKRERRLHPLARPRRAVVGSQRCAASSPASWP